VNPERHGKTFEGATALKRLAFDPAKLNGISERLIRSHCENNYGATVKALTTVNKRLSELLAKGYAALHLQRPEA
jgi:Fe-Mn family superoxide dismutase